MRTWTWVTVLVCALGCSTSSSSPGAGTAEGDGGGDGALQTGQDGGGPPSDAGSPDVMAPDSPADTTASDSSVDGTAPDSAPADSGPSDGAGDAVEEPAPACTGGTATPLLPSGASVSGVSGATNFQTITNTVTIPSGTYGCISLQLKLTTGCVGNPPAGQNWPTNCDPYDRLVHLTLADPGATPLLLLDAATPFGADATWTIDLTDYAPALVGTHTFSLAITTYADPTGKQAGTNAQWGADAELTLSPGMPPRDVVAVVPIWVQRIDTTTSQPLSAQVTAPAGAAHARLDFYTTGHGAAGAQMECDEFCQKTNTVTFDGASVFSQAPWRDCSNDCSPQVPISQSFSCGGQTFNYYCGNNPTSCPVSPTFPRANWCPAQAVAPVAIALPDSAAATGMHSVGLAITNVEGYFQVGMAAVFWQ